MSICECVRVCVGIGGWVLFLDGHFDALNLKLLLNWYRAQSQTSVQQFQVIITGNPAEH